MEPTPQQPNEPQPNESQPNESQPKPTQRPQTMQEQPTQPDQAQPQPTQPKYNKPSTPGISMNFDNTVSIYHVVGPTDSFEKAVVDTISMIREANEKFPEWPRMMYLDITGHSGTGPSGFDDDFTEFQQELFFSTMAPFLTAFDLPLTGPLLNPEPQRNDLPDSIVIK